MARSRGPTIRLALIGKSREAALNAVQTFNNPLTTFKAETFIVLMVIAWMYLLHAYYREAGIDYRYFDKGAKRRKFHRTKSGAFKHWELERCLNEKACPLDGPTKSNLRFLIGLRHEIEHHLASEIKDHFSGRFMACCLNYERYICSLFGERYSLGEAGALTLQFRDMESPKSRPETVKTLPSNVAKYLREFDADLSEEDLNSPHFRCRFLFVPIVTSKEGQANEVIQFVRHDSELAKMINEDIQQVYLKEVERPKHLPSKIWKLMQEEGYPGFKQRQHTLLWKKLDAKNPGKGYGVQVANTWYWYDRWVDKVREHCAANESLYGPEGEEKPLP